MQNNFIYVCEETDKWQKKVINHCEQWVTNVNRSDKDTHNLYFFTEQRHYSMQTIHNMTAKSE